MDKKLVSIRGAVTAQNNVKSITDASVRLIDAIYLRNGITDDDVVNVTFSLTDDITAFYPARAVREAGHNVPLFSALEPKIVGALKSCIRVMVTCYSENPVRNVYLNGARVLRPDLCSVYSVALDGPSGAGKSTVAKAVAKKLGITYLDTGALYRALGLKLINSSVPSDEPKAVEKCLKNVQVSIKYTDGVQSVLLDGEDVSGKIRTPEVSMAASNCSAIPYVREKLLSLQRDIAKTQSVILDGRDIGTVVLPSSEFKFYLTATAEERARRRYEELKAKGEDVTYEGVLEDVNKRDKNDMTRKIAPLKKSYDAIEVNSTDMTAEQVIDYVVGLITGAL